MRLVAALYGCALLILIYLVWSIKLCVVITLN